MIINKLDNVEINLENGHKYALRDIKSGENVIKYGNPIGHATADITKGEHVHTHNMKTNLSGELTYTYSGRVTYNYNETDKTFLGYVRPNGDIGIRNEIWIIPTVGCVNKIAEKLSSLTGAYAYTHPFGCSQLGDDQKTTQLILKGLVNHPNAGGVLVLGLGCENNNITEFKKVLGEWDGNRVKFLNCQDFEDELHESVKVINELKDYAREFVREPVPVSKLRVGLKCGGSDGYSGISANPLLGRFSDKLTSFGGTVSLTEVPEMFGAEHLLMERAENEDVFNKCVSLINDFKNYYVSHNQVVYENPSPGNKAGGITTLEEKSLGCIKKGGSSAVVDVLGYGERIKKTGLSVLDAPGNDLIAATALAAAGCQLVLFTTGRGTPFSTFVPTMKISTNENLTRKKNTWIDFSAHDMDADGLYDLVKKTVNGEYVCKSESVREIAFYKTGVTL